ncbi:MAG TPA: patatin-like phospholipase family protein, partial [Acidobacteriota bacterium]
MNNRLIILIALYLFTSFHCYAQVPNQPENSQAIGVVLSGGGARGFAHVGVLKTLEDFHIPIARIGGTSMGSFVACLYSVGYSPEEIRNLILATDWDDLFDDRIQKRHQFYPDKSAPPGFVLEFGLTGVKLKLPTGLSAGKKLTNLIAALTAHSAGVKNFSDLPTPFTTVATDLLTGEKVILDGSRLSLPESVRASMGVPIFFTPFDSGKELLIDGGITSNSPVRAVKDIGANYVIAVDASARLLSKENVQSLTDVLDQITSLPVKASSKSELAEADLVIVPAISAGSRDFSDPATIISNGEEAAKLHSHDLERLQTSLPTGSRLTLKDQIKIESVILHGSAAQKQRYLLGSMGLEDAQDVTSLELY